MLPRLLIVCSLLATPALAREIRGRVSHTEDGSEAFRATLGNIYVLRANLVTDSGEVTTVYNLRVAEYHTYFVGTSEWGFSVWAHNASRAYGGISGSSRGSSPR